MGLEAIFKGWTGELKTRFINKLILNDQYKVFNNVIIKTERGSTQIDHVIVSPYGLFSVETKDKNGWIYGDEKQKQWTQKIFKNTYKFQNPLHQNYAHTMSLSEYLGVEHEKIFSLIIFWGDCEFKTKMPDNVCKGGIFNNEFKAYIQSKNKILFSPDVIDSICTKLNEAKKNSGLIGSWKHVKEVKSRYQNDTKCPKCGGDLVKRISSRGENRGKSFLGCKNYPRCKYIKDTYN
ncbi:NERD domain-containing protein [Chloroflexota bacterium]